MYRLLKFFRHLIPILILISSLQLKSQTAQVETDKEVCSSSTTINAITPNGVWSTSGGATIVSPSSTTSVVNNLDQGANSFTYTAIGYTPANLVVTNNTIVVSATEQLPYPCSNTSTITGNSTPVIPSGQWSLAFQNDDVIIDNTAASTTTVNNLPFGTTTLVWTVYNGTCSDAYEINITKDLPANNLGTDKSGCTNTFYIGASSPPSGGNGIWTNLPGSSAVFDNTTSPSVQITAQPGISNVRWSITYNTCTSTKDYVVTNNLPVPNAGKDTSICKDDIILYANALQSGESGKWSVIAPQNEIFSNTADPTSTVSGIKQGTTTFEWMVTNSFCSATDLIQITNNRPDVDAGSDDVICSSDYTLNANNPLPHTGTWTSNPLVTFNNVNQYNATVSGLENDTYILTWTIDNGDCIASDDVTITSDFVTISAGFNQTECSSSFALTGTDIPPGGSGHWTRTFGNGIITNSLSANTNVTDVGEISRFRWTIISGLCTYTDEVQLSNQLPSQAVTNPDKAVCSNQTTIMASPPENQNETGAWSVENGGNAKIASSNLFQTSVSNLDPGLNTFKWTINNQNCSTEDDIVVTNNSITSNAGNDTTICANYTNMKASLPSGSGFWTSTNSSVIFTDSTDPNTLVSNLSFGENSFTWTRNYLGCSASDQVIITNNLPANVTAGDDQYVCEDLATITGNTPTHGSGTWTLESGGGTIEAPNSSQTNINNLSLGTSTFRWTVTYNGCVDFDDVEVYNNRIVVNAGENQTICNTASATLAGTEPQAGQTGIWTVIGGNGIFENNSVYNTNTNGLIKGINTFRWTVSDLYCTNYDEVTITNDTPDAAQVGEDKIICTNNTQITAVSVSNGIGYWSVSSGAGTFENSLNATTNVSSINPGTNTYAWTVTRNNCSLIDYLNITNNTVEAEISSSDNSICSSTHSTTLTAVDPSLIGATGVWKRVSAGSSTIESPSNYETIVSNLDNGINRFRWTVQNATCSDFSEVTVFDDFYDASADAVGPTAVCDESIAILGNPPPATGSGLWTSNNVNVTFDNLAQESTYARNLPTGTTNLTWSITNNGCSASISFDVTNNSITVSAGEDIVGCESEQTLNADVLGAGQSGSWTASNSFVTFDNSTNPLTVARNIPAGTSELTWTITENGCFANDKLFLTNNSFSVDAGTNQVICSDSYTLSGSNPLTGTGAWTVVAGSGTFANPNTYISDVSNLPNGTSTFRWTVTRNLCTASDEVSITNDLYLAEASAPSEVCIDEVEVSAQTLPTGSGATGIWTTLQGGGVFDNANDYVTTARGLALGSNQFRWTVTKGACTDFINIEVINNRVVVSAGTDIVICIDNSELFASYLAPTATGEWICDNPGVIISSPNNPNTVVSNLERGTNTFTWTVNNSGCVGNDMVTITNNSFDANAGPDQEITISSATMAAELPPGATGKWSYIAGNCTFTNDSDPVTTISNVGLGSNTYRWSVHYNNCDAQDDVQIFYNVAESYAGQDQVSCNDFAILDADVPAFGSGVWSVIEGTGNFEDPTDPETRVNDVSRGINTYRWTVTAFEAVASDDVSITNNSFDIYAGEDVQTCNTTVQLNAEDAGVGIGYWTILTGSGTFTNNNDNNATVSNMFVGNNHYIWRVDRNSCSAMDTVQVTHYQQTTTANAGEDASLCNENEYTLNANQPTYGTGTWTSSNSEVIFDLPNSYNTIVRNLPEGPTTFYWTIANEHCQSQDEVNISSWNSIEITENPNNLNLSTGANAQFTVITTGSVENYQWQKDETDIMNGGRISGANNADLFISNVTQDDAGYYKCIVNGYCNQFESYAAALSVAATSLEDITQSEIKLYPNPSTGIVNFEFGEEINKVKSLKIYHLSGKKIFDKTNVNTKETFDLSNNEDGSYIIIIDLGYKLLQSKLIIRK